MLVAQHNTKGLAVRAADDAAFDSDCHPIDDFFGIVLVHMAPKIHPPAFNLTVDGLNYLSHHIRREVTSRIDKTYRSWEVLSFTFSSGPKRANV